MKIKIIPVVGVAVAVMLTGCTVTFETVDDGVNTIESESTFTPAPSMEEWDPEPEPFEPEPFESEPFESELDPETEPDSSRGVTANSAASEARDEAAAIMQGWDSSFRSPPIVFYDDELQVDGETFDPDTAAWYDGKIYIDPDTFADGGGPENVYYTIGHELGHGWEEHVDPYYPVGRSSELYADCMAGAIGAEAGWDIDAMADYTRYMLGEDDIHGDGDDRYTALMGGANQGPDYCDLDH